MHLSPSVHEGLKTQAVGHLEQVSNKNLLFKAISIPNTSEKLTLLSICQNLAILNSVLLQLATPPAWKKNQERNQWN